MADTPTIIEIFDPPMCCPGGLCGPALDPALLDIQEAILKISEEFDRDAQLARQRAELRESFDAFQRANASGAARQAMLTQVREQQARVQAHPLVKEYLRTKDTAEAFLRQINGAISSIVGLDLADAGRPTGGCC